MHGEPGQPPDDETLIRQHLADPRGPAAAALIARWQDRVYQWAYRVARDRDVALDIAQEALTNMYQALPRYEPRGRFSAWLFTIVHNRARSAVRTRALMRDPELEPDSLVAPGAGPAEQYESAEWEQRVLEAMNGSLEPHERTALWLRAYEGMSVADIDSMMGFSGASGARGVLQTARRKLRAALDRGEPPG